MSALEYWLWLASLPKLGVKAKHALLEHFASPEELYKASDAKLREVEDLTERGIRALGNKSLNEADRISRACAGKNIRIVTFADPDYPERLRNIYAPPILIYVKGELPSVDDNAVIAVVGTRKCTPYGARTAERLAFGIAGGGAVVVTGLAAGIDKSAAEGALAAGGRVIGVLGCAIDKVYPAQNERIFKAVERSGALISEYAPGERTFASCFPARNRIISALSLGVVVIEAPERSGALITASRALEQGKDVFVVPGNIDADSCTGSNSLLKDGAIPVTLPQDVLKEYQAVYPDKIDLEAAADFRPAYASEKKDLEKNVEKTKYKVIDNTLSLEYKKYEGSGRPPAETESLGENEKKLLAAISRTPIEIGKLSSLTGLPFADAMELITELELFGYIKELPGGKVVLI